MLGSPFHRTRDRRAHKLADETIPLVWIEGAQIILCHSYERRFFDNSGVSLHDSVGVAAALGMFAGSFGIYDAPDSRPDLELRQERVVRQVWRYIETHRSHVSGCDVTGVALFPALIVAAKICGIKISVSDCGDSHLAPR